jgi:hypothetical protein
MKVNDEKNLVPVKEIEVLTQHIELTRGVSPESLSVPRPDLAGLRLTPLQGGPIYVVNPEGFLLWIPNPSTYNSLFRDWSGVYRVDTANMSIGAALSDGAILAKGSLSAKVYLVSNGRKRWITSPATMDKYYFNWSRVYVVPQILIDSMVTGASWS